MEREVEIFKRDEFIGYVLKNNIDLSKYFLELNVPKCYSCTIETIKSLEVDDKLFILEEDKMICLYLE